MKNTQMLTYITVLLLTTTAFADRETPGCRVALLPIEQSSARPHARISNKRLEQLLEVQFTHLKNVSLIDYEQLTQLVDQSLVDDAVFELLITDGLLETLAHLDTLQSASAKLQEQLKVAHDRNIRYLIQTSITPIRRQWHVSYRITDTKTGAVVHARSFYEVDNRPAIVAQELAKRIMRAMWKAMHKS
jgi:hypothetical protein